MKIGNWVYFSISAVGNFAFVEDYGMQKNFCREQI
jgi:hypothetical protein